MANKVLVTGGAGYIGSHTILELINSGFEPIIIDNLCNSNKKNIEGIEIIANKKVKWYNIDCTDINLFNKVFKNEHNIVGIIHFAAYKAIEESVRFPEKYYKNNIGSLKVILELMKMYSVDHIIFSSSCTVYGTPDILPVNEDAPFKEALSPYAETKQVCENLLSNSNKNSISLRYFNPIGCHPSGLIGDCSKDKPANLIPIIAEVAIGKRDHLIINGNDYDTPDGTCIRDYIHVTDLANSHVKALEFILKNKGKHKFNIGTGKGSSILSAIKAFEKASGVKINYKLGNRRNGDVEKIFADNSKAKKQLKWKANISFEIAMKDAWNWEVSKKNNPFL